MLWTFVKIDCWKQKYTDIKTILNHGYRILINKSFDCPNISHTRRFKLIIDFNINMRPTVKSGSPIVLNKK